MITDVRRVAAALGLNAALLAAIPDHTTITSADAAPSTITASETAPFESADVSTTRSGYIIASS